MTITAPPDATLPALMTALDIGQEVDWDPQHLGYSAWLEHVPFAFWLVKVLRPRSIVELGTHHAVSYSAFCQAVERCGYETRCSAIDTWAGDPHAGEYGDDIFAAVDALNKRWSGFSSLLRSTFADARPHFGPASIDLLHIDGCHTHEAVAADFEMWRDALSDRAVVLLHDTNERQRDFGVWRFWQEVASSRPQFEFLHGHGLGVLGAGSELPQALRAFFAASTDAHSLSIVRGLFASRGRAVGDRYYRRRAEDGLHALRASREAAEQQKNEQEAQLHVLRLRIEAVAEQSNAVASLHQKLGIAETNLQAERQAQAAVRAERDALLRSSSWRITFPLRVAMRLARGDRAVRSRLLAIPHAWGAAHPGGAMARMIGPEDPRLPSELLAERLPNLRALACFAEPAAPARLTMLTDSISAGSLFGGVGTAILLSVLLAQRLGIPLRIVTREAEPVPGNFATVLQAHGLSHQQNVEFLHAPLTPGAPSISMGEQDLLLTTSWWTTWSALRGFDPARIIYLLQEDERMFYPAGDEQLLCQDVFCDTRLRFIVNTSALRDHLITEGMEGIAANSIAFEPAFPSTSYHPGPRAAGAARRFFFYARPENPRNLFLRGAEVLAAAIERGVLRPEDWIFHIVGKNVPRIKFPSGVRVEFVEALPWPEYAALIRSIDVGLSLMYTPHPSYPPLDLAASGAVVVTNRYGSKISLDHYSKNILCVDPNVDSLVAAISEAVKLADDKPRRLANFDNAGISRDWEAAFGPVLDRLAG